MLYMLDTDTASFAIKRTSHSVLRRLEHVPVDDVCISAISYGELQYGIVVSPHQKRDHELCGNFLRYLTVLPFEERAGRHYGEIRGALKVTGQMIGPNDLLIAAHAKSEGLILVTNNTREFERVPGLRIENWAEPVR